MTKPTDMAGAFERAMGGMAAIGMASDTAAAALEELLLWLDAPGGQLTHAALQKFALVAAIASASSARFRAAAERLDKHADAARAIIAAGEGRDS